MLASRVFRPSRPDRVVDSGIERAQTARTVIGTLATLWLIYAYPLQGSATDLAKNKFGEIFTNTGILLVAGPLALAGFVLAARPPVRRLYGRRLIAPVTGFCALFGCPALLWFLFRYVIGGGATAAQRFGLLEIVVLPLGLGAALFALFFAVSAAVLSVHYVFRTADVHEVLPPLISPVLVWVMCGFQLVDTPDVAAPTAVRLLFLISPPVSVTALSAWELRRLRTHFGISIRRALNR
ncbi:hypothetical protein ACFU7T_10120 [Streptomyces sp. NPDC057555]|uniref:hypothetical protein n=1 Tax=Streptomyces sp. NPDC057555 TaxID=3346166 RepID=UPI0036CA2174